MQKEERSMPIKDWADDDKPREKMLHKGRAVLSDAELLAILLGSGSRAESAVGLAKRMLAAVDNDLNSLGRRSIKQLMDFKGVGTAKAVTIAAALEIGRRRRDNGPADIVKIGSSSDAYELLRPLIGELEHEEFWTVYLNNSNKVIHKAQLSKGGITGTLVDVRLVMKQALELGAVALILAHNHPSGGLKPSTADKRITEKIKAAGSALDVKVLDHLIIVQQDYFSFADNALL